MRPTLAPPATAGVPRPRTAAHPTSPVGRTCAELAADPTARTPLRGLDLTGYTDRELHALTEALLAEKHRRNTRWLGLGA